MCLEVAVRDITVGGVTVVDHSVTDNLAALDLFVAAAVVAVEVSRGSRSRGETGQSDRSTGKSKSKLFHFILHRVYAAIGVDGDLDPVCRTTIGQKAQNCRKLSRRAQLSRGMLVLASPTKFATMVGDAFRY